MTSYYTLNVNPSTLTICKQKQIINKFMNYTTRCIPLLDLRLVCDKKKLSYLLNDYKFL